MSILGTRNNFKVESNSSFSNFGSALIDLKKQSST